MAENPASGLLAAEVTVNAIESVPGTITPFPGGIVASGSKVGSNKYKFLGASTNEKNVRNPQGRCGRMSDSNQRRRSLRNRY